MTQQMRELIKYDIIKKNEIDLPTITSCKSHSRTKFRHKPLGVEEYERDFRKTASDLQLIERVFYGGIDSNELRAALWPYLFDLVKHRGKFKRHQAATPPTTPTNKDARQQQLYTSNTNGLKSSTKSTISNGCNGNTTTTSGSKPFRSSAPAATTTNGLCNTSSNGIKPSSAQTNGCTTSSNGITSSSVSANTNGHNPDHKYSPTTNGNSNINNNNNNNNNHIYNNHKQNGCNGVSSTSSPAPRKERSRTSTGQFVYIEHEKNIERWRELERLFHLYESQWKSITPDQEMRFSTFRERKSLIERDVIRSDRSHPFYADNSDNLTNLTTLLMTYMMYDFDIGYLQGMSDLAAPILYVFNGDLVKSFWIFVEVMKLFRQNFEYSQKTIHFQLNCLFRLIRLTDPKFAHYLSENECSNCFFAFRCIVCLFKRELMRNGNSKAENVSSDEDDFDNEQDEFRRQDDYARVLSLWDTIWCVQRRHELLSKSYCVHTFNIANGSKKSTSTRFPPRADVPRLELTETEKFVLSLCLSLIRRERNQILLNRMDGSEIHQHFIKPRLANDLERFIDHAYEIYDYLNTDCDLQRVVKGANKSNGDNGLTDFSPMNESNTQSDIWHKESYTPDTYDLLKDYFIISPTKN